MRQPTGQISRFGTLKSLLQRFAFLALIGVTFALMLIGKADTVLVERARIAVTDAVTPLLRVMSEPASAIASTISNIRELGAIRKENAALREANARLMQWQYIAQRLESENRDLRGLVALVPEPAGRFVSARVVADTGGAFAQSIIVNAGSADGIAKGQIVMSGEGLVGRVTEVGSHSARVLLITDINSRLPVLVGDSGARAIMAGNNGGRPRLLYLTEKTGVASGDKIVTSGDAEAFPVGLPVGQIARLGEGITEIEPYMSSETLQFVRIYDFGLANTIASTKPAPAATAQASSSQTAKPSAVPPTAVITPPAYTPPAATLPTNGDQPAAPLDRAE